jgi:hypothetical protein
VITPKLLREWGACWSDDRIFRHFGTRPELSPSDIATDASISLDDRLWVLCRSIWYLDESSARLFAIESASLVAHLAGDDEDQAIYAGLMNDLLLIEDMPVDRREAARASAYAAARAAAYAYADAYADAYAYAAARAAAYAYAYADYAYDAAIQKAIDRALYWLGDYADGWEEP